MRSDMAKVIVERPRFGGSWSKEYPAPDWDAQPRRESLRARWRSRKGLNENLAPLRRYLRKQVGRPWDDVYSEICANLRVTSTVQQHVRDHVPDFVAFNTTEIDGAVWFQHKHIGLRPLAEGGPELVVCPRSGVLRTNPYWPRARWTQARRAKLNAYREALAARMVEVERYVQLHKLGGDWFEVRLARIRREAERPLVAWDLIAHPMATVGNDWSDRWAREDVVIAAGLWSGRRATLYGRTGVYAVAKRQLSKRDLKRRGLR